MRETLSFFIVDSDHVKQDPDMPVLHRETAQYIGVADETTGQATNLCLDLGLQGQPHKYRIEYPEPRQYSLGKVVEAEGVLRAVEYEEEKVKKAGLILSEATILYDDGLVLRGTDFLLTVVEDSIVTDVTTGMVTDVRCTGKTPETVVFEFREQMQVRTPVSEYTEEI